MRQRKVVRTKCPRAPQAGLFEGNLRRVPRWSSIWPRSRCFERIAGWCPWGPPDSRETRGRWPTRLPRAWCWYRTGCTVRWCEAWIPLAMLRYCVWAQRPVWLGYPRNGLVFGIGPQIGLLETGVSFCVAASAAGWQSLSPYCPVSCLHLPLRSFLRATGQSSSLSWDVPLACYTGNVHPHYLYIDICICI